MASNDSLGNYILFSTGSRQPTRAWNRAETSGTDYCAPRVHEKLKYYVLKHPPATAAPVVLKSTNPTIQIGRATYSIDRNIYPALVQSLAAAPVFTLLELQARIKLVRAELGQPAPISVQLADVPLSQYKRRYTYDSSTNSWPQERLVNNIKSNVQFDYPFVLADFVNFPDLNLIPRFGLFKYIFLGQSLNYNLARYVYITANTPCSGRKSRVNDLFTGGDADRFGASILSVKSLLLFQRTGVKFFYPLATTMVHASTTIYGGKNPIEFGLLIGINGTILRRYNIPITIEFLRRVDENSQFIFIPTTTQLDLLDRNVPANGSGITFPLNNGGDFSKPASIKYNERLRESNFKTRLGYKKLTPVNEPFFPYVDINFDINAANVDISNLG